MNFWKVSNLKFFDLSAPPYTISTPQVSIKMSKQQNAKNVNENAKEIVAMKNVVCKFYPNDLDFLQAQSLIFTQK